VRETRQDLPLVAELAAGGVAIDVAFDDFDGDALLKRTVVADGFVDGALAALPKTPDDAVRTDPFVARRRAAVFRLRRHGPDDRRDRLALAGMPEQGRNFPPNLVVGNRG
jgi:hypothetical protein